MQAIVKIQTVRNCTALFTRSKVLFQSKTELSLASVHVFLNSILLLLPCSVLKQLCLITTWYLEPSEMKADHNREQKALYRKLLSNSNFLWVEKLLSHHHYSMMKDPFYGRVTRKNIKKKKFFTYQTISRKYEVSSTGFPEKGNNLYFKLGSNFKNIA